MKQHTYQPGEQIQVLATNHSGLRVGQTGTVEKDMGCGCAVHFEVVSYISQFGGATKSEPRTVFMAKSEIKPHQQIQHD